MPNKATLKDIISTFTEEELSIEVPIDFQDPNLDDSECVNTYNQFLAQGKYQEAYEHRKNHPELEKYIFDAKKLNYLQSLIINSYLYVKGEYSAEKVGVNGEQFGFPEMTTLQDALDMIIPNLTYIEKNFYKIEKVAQLPQNPDPNIIYLVMG